MYHSTSYLTFKICIDVVNKRSGFKGECVVLLKKTRSWVLAPLSGDSQLPITSAPGHLTSSSVLLTSRVTCVHV